MKRNEKIEKLERLGIFNQWKYNTERANETFNIECPDFSMTNEERMMRRTITNWKVLRFPVQQLPPNGLHL